MLCYFHVPVSWGELLKRTAKEIYTDNCLGLAAELAFYFFLALFPALLFLVSLISLLPVENVMDEILRTLGQFAPEDVLRIVRDQIQEIARSSAGGILTFALLGTIWSSSAAVSAIIDTLNRAYDIVDSRPFWKTRLLAIGLTIALAVFVILSFTLVLVGPTIAEGLANRVGLGPAFTWTWTVLQWPVVFLLGTTAFGIVYYFAPDAEQEWVWITPGAVIGTLLWLLASLGFRVYLTSFGNYNETYGTIGGFIVLMLWFYISGLALLAGAELNAEIEHLSPYGKAPGEKQPGERKKIGVAAAHAYEERVKAAKVLPPQADEGPNCPIDLTAAQQRQPKAARLSDLLIGGLVLAPLAAIKIRESWKQLNGKGATSPAPTRPAAASHPSPSTPDQPEPAARPQDDTHH